MTEEDNNKLKECSEFVNSKLASFTYVKKVEEYFEEYYHITYLMEHDFIISISMRYDEMKNEQPTCGICIYQKKQCILSDWATLELIDTYLKNVQEKLNNN